MSYKIRHVDKWSATDPLPELSRRERVWLLAERHRGAVIAGILAASLAAVVLGALLWMQHQRGQEAAALAAQAGRAYFERPGADAQTAHANIETAVRLYRRLLEEFPQTSGAQQARYLLGNVLAEQGDYAGAIEVYQRFIDQPAPHPVLLGLVYQRLGAAHLAAGEQEKGLQAYTHVLQTPNALNKDQTLFELATLEHQANHPDQALAHYRQLVDDHPTSPFVSEAAMRIRALAPPDAAEDAAEGNTAQDEGQAGDADTP